MRDIFDRVNWLAFSDSANKPVGSRLGVLRGVSWGGWDICTLKFATVAVLPLSTRRRGADMGIVALLGPNSNVRRVEESVMWTWKSLLEVSVGVSELSGWKLDIEIVEAIDTMGARMPGRMILE